MITNQINQNYDKNQKYRIWFWCLLIFNFFLLTILYLDNHAQIKRYVLNFLNIYDLDDKDSLSQLEITSYHEAGHTLIILLYPDDFEFSYVTINPSGRMLGHAKYTYINPNNWKGEVLVALGGTAAEKELAQNNQISKEIVGKGSSSDFRKAKNLLNNHSSNPKSDFDHYLKESQQLLHLNKTTLKQIAQQLLLKRTLSNKDIKNILQQYPLQTN
ncbi:hypothetical protein [Candidatus Phytoplasma meliae]|uniref:Peptidase M41 domain-containing protein n=1 Tax=Candidatus Phytoplasma meliae TaxID=1848402 RepID=A0ABS5CXL0_9MOLU|nr:hypothetical protein [Candidatus Phytoplasma meliae]MBP5835712.1 hypothetical protein [Candidatus Phytoplasma meliae]